MLWQYTLVGTFDFVGWTIAKGAIANGAIANGAIAKGAIANGAIVEASKPLGRV